ncbi:glutamine synthetase III [Sinanaerobacter chloroacetimidivorans]|jgi:glutamine synthetase|uniref:Glutamine synthetase III n=1 Tax=Sinanaerobacter chloroacetimidivorans TaxID=2818044 RepID=A0A8J7W0A4_9FIRM|nr:glutamine synthetase III [Sinanaerobacter chloroacetimidivorans]MBR0598409.1 glutamine synthetase III [Sinanaerobacter chloroacetimidivorans]
MSRISEIFGSMVFNDAVMKEKLPKGTYKALKKNMEEGTNLTLEVANVVANAMKDWALEKGATHFTHWFQPMTGVTAEKHDSFISPTDGGGVIMEFSGKELIKGEPDASSFPSGGIRATFEARGYTNWDPSSYAFIKENTLCIPTAFCSYGGEALDKKTPLLRSMEALNVQALRILKLLGYDDVRKVDSTVGPEQEYFLINKELYDKRKDLIYCGRTLFGAKPPKNQELEDHYFGAIKPRVNDYMAELDEELWKLGILAKTEHNEVAPSQHEFAPIFTTNNIATDHNQLAMEIMKKVALNHGLVCLLHEKPFAGINGSGKHINWSLSTDTGMNLLSPSKSPATNLKFLLFLCAVIKAVDEYQDLLRTSVASPGNDHRLGGNEAPPAIISMFIGEDLEAILNAIEKDEVYSDSKDRTMNIGVQVLPPFQRDTTDRNRTSPFAFTGNKFEFRMAGSNASISCPSYVLNTTVAEALSQFADELEASSDFESSAKALIKNTIIKHKRIIFNGNNYSDEWVIEAEKRGLLNLKSAVDAYPLYTSEKNLALFKKHCIFTEVEVRARQEIVMKEYCNLINIEALTMVDMVNKDILPAVSGYIKSLTETAIGKKAVSSEITCELEEELISNLSSLSVCLYKSAQELDNALIEVNAIENVQTAAEFYNKKVLSIMKEVRGVADTLETMTASSAWPFPTFGELLFSV